MSVIGYKGKFSPIDVNAAYLIHTKNGKLLRPGDANPIIFVAGEGDKYKFMLRSLYLSRSNQLNVLLMSLSDITTPTFTLQIKLQDESRVTIYSAESILCPHGSRISRDQHFHEYIPIEQYILNFFSRIVLKLSIGGTPVPFHIWSADTSGIGLEADNSELAIGAGTLRLG
jgi:hypothetical protein